MVWAPLNKRNDSIVLPIGVQWTSSMSLVNIVHHTLLLYYGTLKEIKFKMKSLPHSLKINKRNDAIWIDRCPKVF